VEEPFASNEDLAAAGDFDDGVLGDAPAEMALGGVNAAASRRRPSNCSTVAHAAA
jgi:hypothetical protein